MDEEWNKEYIKSIKYLFELNNKNKHKMIETTEFTLKNFVLVSMVLPI